MAPVTTVYKVHAARHILTSHLHLILASHQCEGRGCHSVHFNSVRYSPAQSGLVQDESKTQGILSSVSRDEVLRRGGSAFVKGEYEGRKRGGSIKRMGKQSIEGRCEGRGSDRSVCGCCSCAGVLNFEAQAQISTVEVYSAERASSPGWPGVAETADTVELGAVLVQCWA